MKSEFAGVRVKINALPSYIKTRVQRGYCFLRVGMYGTILNETAAGDKYGILFDDQIWESTRTSFANGCHGASDKILHCSYITKGCASRDHIDVMALREGKPLPSATNDIHFEDDNLLLLL